MPQPRPLRPTRPVAPRSRRAALLAIGAVLSLVATACIDRPLDDPSGLDGSSGSHEVTAGGGDDMPQDDHTSSDSAPPMADETGSDSSGELPPDPCEPYRGDNRDPQQTCGLTQVQFAWESIELDAAAQCQLQAAAPCIVEQRAALYLEAHASADEGRDEEGALLLSEQRGAAVEEFLVDRGVDSTLVQVIAKGNLESTPAASDEDRRVLLLYTPQA